MTGGRCGGLRSGSRSHTTAACWVGRYRRLGAAGMADRPSRPHASPRRTPVRTERRIIGLRVSRRLGPTSWSASMSRNPATSLTEEAGGPPDGSRAARTSEPAPPNAGASDPVIGYGSLHTALDDHCRLACTEILPDERKETATAFLARAHGRYAAGITIERVISDNGACYRSRN